MPLPFNLLSNGQSIFANNIFARYLAHTSSPLSIMLHKPLLPRNDHRPLSLQLFLHLSLQLRRTLPGIGVIISRMRALQNNDLESRRECA